MSEQGLTAPGSDYSVPRPESAALARARAEERVCFYSNCWIFALWRLFRRRGFLIISKSEWGWWWHFMWSPDMRTVQQFEPTLKRRKRLFPPFIYKGYVKETLL